ncbi:MAG TPA: alkaline phosphatase family protein [Solirubrobacteraceae bacterium]|nr:alkaline phosphatase family protein [Solirubrobacteraceae bacterium]
MARPLVTLRALLAASALFAIAAPVVAVLMLTGGRSRSARPPAAAGQLPPIRHVWVIMLENDSYASTFGEPRADPYLARTLARRGALLERYYAIGHESNDNYVSFVSGQPPNPENQGDCHVFADFRGGRLEANGIESGMGCVYPNDVPNLGTELTAAGLSWKAYEQDMGNDPRREAAACGHPRLNAVDHTQAAVAGDGYAARHDPFIYFHSVIDRAAYCDAHIVALGSPRGRMPAAALPGETGLASDLRAARTTPAFSFITPNLCADGHDQPCVNERGGPTALSDVDAFLRAWVPRIMASPAYRAGGLIEITFDEADGLTPDASACCGEYPGPAAPSPGIAGPGGGRVGAVLISPFIAPGTRTRTPYNHYSSLATFEDLFGVPRLGDARTVTRPFGRDVFTRAAHR